MRLPAHASLYARFPRGSRLLSPVLRLLRVPAVPLTLTHSETSVRLLLDPGGTHQLGLLHSRNFDAVKVGVVLSSVKPGDLFVDVGSSWGYFSLIAGSLGARVLAVECDPLARSEWCRAVDRHGSTGAILAPYAAGETDGERVAVSRPWFRHNAVTGQGSSRVTTVTVDSLVRERVAFLKVDAEGADLAVLKGARRVLAEDRPLVVTEVSREWPAMRAVMAGYDAFGITERPPCFRRLSEGEPWAGDVLFVPR